MKSSLIILSTFIAGMLVGTLHIIPANLHLDGITMYILYLLLFLVGLCLSLDNSVWRQLRQMNYRILLIPITTFVGTAIGIIAYNFLFSYPGTKDAFAIGAGFGYYSLSSIIISKQSGELMGIIALLANIIREITTLVLAPVFVKYFGKLAPIAVGGATSMDTTLPIIMKYSGKEYVIGSLLNGILLTILVPILLGLIYSF